MKTAALGDIHANLPALEAVLADLKKRNASQVWILGDLLGYNAFPNEVVQLVKSHATYAVIGNYDRKVLQFSDKEKEWKQTKRPEKFFSFRWTSERLAQSNSAYLATLPNDLRLEVAGKSVLLTHGSPDSPKEPLTTETSDERLSELADEAQSDVVVCAHSHIHFVRRIHGCRFVNTGSVGLPADGDPRACYVTLNFSAGRLRVTHHRVAYDTKRAADAILSHGLPLSFANMVLEGKPFEEIASPEDIPTQDSAGEKPTQDRTAYLNQVMTLAQDCDYEVEHTHHVTHLALRLFDALRDLHRYAERERFLLECAALLHDIGWIEGRSGHHKTGMRIILNSPVLQFGFAERCIIGLVARYHRRALPSQKHQHYAALKKSDRRMVSILSAILRVADGLDRTHRSLIQEFSCSITNKEIHLSCEAKWPAEMERQQALDKGELLEQVFQRRLEIDWHLC
jgi:putative phosphoesterase